jgi:pimeloyl-ACP methyl ester carboxylesterase
VLVVHAVIPRAPKLVPRTPVAGPPSTSRPQTPPHSQRSLDRWRASITEHSTVDAFMRTTSLASGVHTIGGDGSPIDLHVRGRRGKPLVFSFHGSRPRTVDLSLPIFTGRELTNNLDVSFVAISDPTLHLSSSLRLGWYVGSQAQRLQTILPRILAHLVKVLAAPRVVFLGGSGGGFASLYYAADFPDSLSLVWNPQTDIRRYEATHVEELGRIAFGLTGLAQTKARLPELIDCSLVPVYLPDAQNLVVYLQNNADGHLRHQMTPFLSALGADTTRLTAGASANARLAENVWLDLAHWGDGPTSPPPAVLAALLREILSVPNWRAEIASGGMRERIDRARMTSF